jgi:hypothetical protein
MLEFFVYVLPILAIGVGGLLGLASSLRVPRRVMSDEEARLP